MAERGGILGEMARSSGWLIRCSALAVLLALAVTFVLPPRWGSGVVLLPPEREAANFRYGDTAGARGLAGALRLFTVRDAVDPIDAWQAVLAAPETARRLVRRFDLAERWGGGSEEEAIRGLQDRLRFVEVPWGPLEIRVVTRDRQLSADLANAAVEVLEERLRELYREDVEWERTFLAEAAREEIEAAAGSEAMLAASLARSGIADEDLQARAAAEAARDRAVALARARTERSRAAIRSGPGSAETRDAERRVRELERRAQPILPLRSAGLRAAERDAEQLEESAELLARLRIGTIEQEASHRFALRVLDPAVPAERPDRHVAIPLVLALLLVPASFAGSSLLRRELDALPGEAAGLGALRAAAERAGRWLRESRGGVPVVAVAAAGIAVWFGNQPSALAAALGLAFLVVLATDLRAAWLLLVIALPWAWDWSNVRAEVSVQFPTEPGIIALIAAWAYARALRPRAVRVTPLLAAMGLVIAWTLLCTVTSWNPRNSIFQSVAITGFVLAGGVFPQVEMLTLERIERVIRIFLIAATAAAMIGIVQVIRSPLPFGRAAFHIGEGFLYNHGPFAAFLGFGMGPAFVYLVTARWSRRSLPLLAAAFLITVAMVVSLTRAGWLSMLVLLAALAIARARQFFRKLAVPIALVAVVLAVGFLRSPFALQGFTGYVDRSTDEDYGSNVDRLQRYVAALRMFRDHPLTGVGPGAYELAYDSYRSVDFDAGIRGAHSEILRAASEQGLPGVLILAFLVVSFYRTGLRLMRTAPDPRARRTAAALCAGMLTYSVHGLVNEYWREPKIALTMWVFAGLLGALDRIPRGEESAA